MIPLPLHELHERLGARFSELSGAAIVNDYGDWLAEHAALHQSAGVLDFSFRSRICLTGADRVRFLHGQATNDVKKLRVGEGGYAALTTNKGKMVSDLNIFCLADELLLDFEPGLTGKLSQRLEKFIVADDVQIVDIAPLYGLLSVQGPKAEEVIQLLGWGEDGGRLPRPREPFNSVKISDVTFGEIYLMNQPRLSMSRNRGNEAQIEEISETPHVVSYNFGFDLFVPNASLGAAADKLIAAANQIGGRVCGWQAFETARIEAGIPRFGVDMDETNLPLECGPALQDAVSYHKGCYIGQEVINRIHSFGHVTKELCGLRLAGDLKSLPQRGDKLLRDGREVGYITSAIRSPALIAPVAPKLHSEGGNIALGYVRREANQIGNEFVLKTAAGEGSAKIVELPF